MILLDIIQNFRYIQWDFTFIIKFHCRLPKQLRKMLCNARNFNRFTDKKSEEMMLHVCSLNIFITPFFRQSISIMASKRKKAHYECKQKAFEEVAKFYTMDEDTLKSEHKMFTHMKETLTDTKQVSSMFKQLADKRMMIMIPELFCLN